MISVFPSLMFCCSSKRVGRHSASTKIITSDFHIIAKELFFLLEEVHAALLKKMKRKLEVLPLVIQIRIQMLK